MARIGNKPSHNRKHLLYITRSFWQEYSGWIIWLSPQHVLTWSWVIHLSDGWLDWASDEQREKGKSSLLPSVCLSNFCPHTICSHHTLTNTDKKPNQAPSACVVSDLIGLFESWNELGRVRAVQARCWALGAERSEPRPIWKMLCRIYLRRSPLTNYFIVQAHLFFIYSFG